jgi:DNA-binding NtrC family response regulator
MTTAASKVATDPLVLLVDDEEDSLELSRAALAEADLDAIGVRTLGDALRALRDAPRIDLVMTDICLVAGRKDRSGLELARYVSEHHRDIPIVGYSALFAEREFAGEQELFDTFWEKSSGDYRALDAFIRRCRRLALQRRPSDRYPGSDDAPDLSIEMAELMSEMEDLNRSVQKVEGRLERVEDWSVSQDRVTWTVMGVIGAVVGLLGGIVALALGVAKLLGG